ncbi:MAG: dienelactone hydrolase family protein [Pseudomonadota bacterium]
MSASEMEGVVLIHGRYASGAAMAPLAKALGLDGLAVAAPDATGGSWWPTSFLAPMAEMDAPLTAALDAVEAQIASLDVPRDRVALVGFSQGACLALEYAARRGVGLGAAIGFSGGLVGTADRGAPADSLYGHADKAFDYGTDPGGVSILVTCHERDPHIPITRVQDSARALEGLGAAVLSIEHAGAGHQPMPDGIAAARAMLTMG